MVKDECFKAEREFRIVHELRVSELNKIRLEHRPSLMSRYLPLSFPQWIGTRQPLLPLAKVMVGPGSHQEITRIGIDVLLRQMGYGQGLTCLSQSGGGVSGGGEKTAARTKGSSKSGPKKSGVKKAASKATSG